MQSSKIVISEVNSDSVNRVYGAKSCHFFFNTSMIRQWGVSVKSDTTSKEANRWSSWMFIALSWVFSSLLFLVWLMGSWRMLFRKIVSDLSKHYTS